MCVCMFWNAPSAYFQKGLFELLLFFFHDDALKFNNLILFNTRSYSILIKL